jgi:hypothetical protein
MKPKQSSRTDVRRDADRRKSRTPSKNNLHSKKKDKSISSARKKTKPKHGKKFVSPSKKFSEDFPD